MSEQEKIMNKILNIIPVIIIIFMLVACSEKEKTASNTADNAKRETVITLVELGSSDCPPCRLMEPVLEEVRNRYGNRVRVVHHDVGVPEGMPYARSYGVRVIPTQVFLNSDGREFFRHEGFLSMEQIEEILNGKGVY